MIICNINVYGLNSYLLYAHIALSRGADILSESFIFSVSGAILVYEYQRSSEKEKRKEEQRLQKIRDDAFILQTKLVSLDKRLEALEEYAKANRKSILGLDVGANYQQPQDVVPIDDSDNISNQLVENDKTNRATLETATNKRAKQRRWFWPFS